MEKERKKERKKRILCDIRSHVCDVWKITMFVGDCQLWLPCHHRTVSCGALEKSPLSRSVLNKHRNKKIHRTGNTIIDWFDFHFLFWNNVHIRLRDNLRAIRVAVELEVSGRRNRTTPPTVPVRKRYNFVENVREISRSHTHTHNRQVSTWQKKTLLF